MSTVRVQDLDMTTLKFSNKTPLSKNGGYMCFLNNTAMGMGKWYLQTPVMRAPFGISRVNPYATNSNPEVAPKVNLMLSFGNSRDPNVKACHDKMKELDRFMVASAVSNSVDWFGKKCSEEVVSEKYNACVRPPSKPADEGKEPFPDSMSLKVYCQGQGENIDPIDELKLYEWDVDRDSCKEVNSSAIWDVIQRGSELQVIFRVNMVYFIGKQSWGLTLKAETIRYIPKFQEPVGSAQFLSAGPLSAPEDVEYEEVEVEEGDVEYVEGHEANNMVEY